MREKKGFTLPEMLVVLLLIGLLSGLAVPLMMDSWQQVRLDYAIQQLHRDLRWAQREAVKEQCRVTVTFYRDSPIAMSFGMPAIRSISATGNFQPGLTS